jgi:hypothetical protein
MQQHEAISTILCAVCCVLCAVCTSCTAEGGMTTLIAAVAKDLPQVVEKLLTVVDKDYINKQTDQGITALLYAANQVW